MEHGFTMVPNYVFACLLGLPAAQLKVLLFVVRRTLGWHKREDRISLSQFEHGVGQEEGTGLSRGTIITAIQGLQDQGLILVDREMSVAGDAATSRFRLGPVFETTVVSFSGHRVAGKANHTKKTDQNIRKHHHDPARATTMGPRMDDDASCTQETAGTSPEQNGAPLSPPGAPDIVIPAPAVVRVTGAAVSQAFVSSPPSTVERTVVDGLELLDQLMASPLGYSERSATQILAQFPVDQIEAGLENLRFRKDVRNPAGWLLRELQSGGYAPPATRPGLRRTLLYALPSAPPGEALAPKDGPGVDAETRLREALAGLSETMRAELLLEARKNHARLAGKPIEKVPEDSFLVQAAFENLVLERLAA